MAGLAVLQRGLKLHGAGSARLCNLVPSGLRPNGPANSARRRYRDRAAGPCDPSHVAVKTRYLSHRTRVG